MQYYDHLIKELKHPQAQKIKRLIETDRLEKIHTDLYICKPTAGYNTRTYNLTRTGYGNFCCNCQGYNKRGSCSHSVALNRVLLKDQIVKKQSILF